MRRQFHDANVVCILAVLSLLTACGANNNYEDINRFMAEVETETLVGIRDIPATELYQPFTYGASNLRSPFVPPVVVPKRTAKQMRNIGVRPPKEHSKQYLERFNIVSLQMVGTMQQHDETWALILDAESGVHRVQVGDYLGTNWGKIESINDVRIDVTEIVSDGAGGWLRRPRTIQLRETQ